MSETKLSDFPDEILEKIFLKPKDNYFCQETVKILTEVCSRFNEIISANAELMRKFTVYWSTKKEEDIEVLLASTRKYQKLSIKDVESISPNLTKFLNNNPLAKISLNESKLTISELQELLTIVGDNLKDLTLEYLNISGHAEEDLVPTNLPKLEHLEITAIECEEMSSIFILFKGAANIKKFSYHEKHKLEDFEAAEFSRMLSSFRGLKVLNLETYEPYFFNDNFLAMNAEFSLQEYVHDSCDAESAYDDLEPFDYEEQLANGCSNLMNFLNGQRTNLEYLKIQRFPVTSEIIDSILSMDKLTSLSIFKCIFRTSRTTSINNRSIKNLWIGHFSNYDEEYRGGSLDRDTEIGFSAILSNCSNVEDLSLFDFDITFGISMCISLYMKNLYSITFASNPGIFPMPFLSVKRMDFTISRFMDYDDIFKVIQVNRQLKSLYLPGDIEDHPNYSSTMRLLNLENLRIEHDF